MSRSRQRELREVPCGGRPESRASVQDPWRQCGAEAAERRTQRLRACLKRTSIGHVETMILGGGQGKRTVGGGKHVSRLICDVNPEGSWEKERTKKDGFDRGGGRISRVNFKLQILLNNKIGNKLVKKEHNKYSLVLFRPGLAQKPGLWPGLKRPGLSQILGQAKAPTEGLAPAWLWPRPRHEGHNNFFLPSSQEMTTAT
jgi:hypothetical protein